MVKEIINKKRRMLISAPGALVKHPKETKLY